MRYFSTNDKLKGYSFETVVMSGLANDGGLFVPEYIPQFTNDEQSNINSESFNEIAFDISKKFIGNAINNNDLLSIIKNAFNFEPKFVELEKDLIILELFHGPTLAFKDYGARFMANVMSHFAKNKKNKLTILVATSGDTGSAVANAFYMKEGIDVYILYPSGMVSNFQEKQLTTFDGNITSIEIDGTFDDCQKIVKSSFIDIVLNKKMNLTSANSINIARLIPQSFYYLKTYKKYSDENITFIVPSGNLGNLTAGLYADKMGMKNVSFISALNSNRMFFEYLLNGSKTSRDTIRTISNAMDVGNPSNLDRIIDLFDNNLYEMKAKICSYYFDDSDTVESLKECFQKYNYLLDPHGAIGYSAMKTDKKLSTKNSKYIILETAHPSKFVDVVEPLINKKIEIPKRLSSCLNKQKKSVKLSNSFTDFKDYLLANS